MDIITIILSALLFFLSLSLLLVTVGRHRCRRSNLPLPPGPRGSPILGNLLQMGSKPHEALYGFSLVHGPLIHLRLGTVDMVVANSAAVAEKILRNDLNFIDRPSSTSVRHVAYNHKDLIFTQYGARWRMLRKICALQLFSPKAMEDLVPVRAEEMGRMVRELAARAGKVVDLSNEVGACATNALSRVVVGKRVFDDGEEAREFKDMVEELMKLSGAFNINDFVPGFGWLDLQGLVRKMKKLHRRFDEFLDGVIAEHREELSEKGRAAEVDVGRRRRYNDLLSVLIDQVKEDGSGEGVALNDADIKPLLQNMFAAGTDTSSNTTEFAVAELIRHPDLLGRAQAELDRVVGRDRLVNESDLPNLPFLQAVIRETFRHHPAAPLSLPRIVSDDCEIDGYLIPGGATLLVNIWAVGRDPRAWPDDPLAFRPDRFMPGGLHEGVDVKGSDFGLIPFGGGRRICAGMNLGMRMVQLMTATLLQAFQWEMPEGQEPEKLDMDLSFGLTLHRTVPLLVRPVPRLEPTVYLSL